MRNALLCLALLAAQPLAASAWYVSSLPAGKIKVDVMEAVSSPRATELTAKLQSTVQADREQWLADVRKDQPEERLEWNERFGLTREERDELHRLGSEVTFVKTGEAEIEFVRASDGRVMLQPDSSLSELSGIVIDVENDFVDTPFGRATEHSDVTAGQEQSGGGTWNGVQWTLDAPGETPSTGTTIQLAIGHLVFDGRGILKYEAKQVEDGKMPRRAGRVIVFPLK